MTINPARSAINGIYQPPGDKSVTHRAFFFGALNSGRTVIRNASSGEDCRTTLRLLQRLGYMVRETQEEILFPGMKDDVDGDELELDCGNSGTTARLAAGFLTGEKGGFRLTGDESLMNRPMERVAMPLRMLGGDIVTMNGGMPVVVNSAHQLQGNAGHVIDVASAQVHGALVLAGLRSAGGIILSRTKQMRDHTLRMCRLFGVNPSVSGGGVEQYVPVAIHRDVIVDVPGDISSAVYMIVASLLLPGSKLTVKDVGLNTTRIAFLIALKEMGGDVEWRIERDGVEPVGTITARYSPNLRAMQFDETSDVSVAEMMDELPLLALVATQAEGTTVVRDVAELRVKESDRIAVTVGMLKGIGIDIEELEDGFRVTGRGVVRGGCTVDHSMDHRLCMVAAVAGLIAEEPIEVPDPEVASISYPDFWKDLERLAGRFTESS